MKTICIFCGSSKGSDPIYAQKAQALGEAVASNGLSLVYGGGDVGLMSLLARAALEKGGK
jgi:predicted Rossmann-fold nucleotide-binding protein